MFEEIDKTPIFIIWLITGTIAFYLSITCYNPDDEVPIGIRFMFACLAFFWNILYIFYYIITVFVLGIGCPNLSDPRDE